MSDSLGTDVSRAARLLQEGRLVAMPTETVYGLAANALDADAVRRIFEAKGRPSSNPLIVHVADAGDINRYVAGIPEVAQRLIDAFCPGPLTLVLPRSAAIPDVVTAGANKVAIRVPAHPIAQLLLRQSGLPLAAPSANPSGYISPTTAQHVLETLGGKVSYILDGGPCERGIESTIVRFDGDTPVILRHGVITREDILRVAGSVSEYRGSDVLAPGMSVSHYSPRTPLVLVDDPEAEVSGGAAHLVGLITYATTCSTVPVGMQIVVSADGNEDVAAQHLYAAMHEMDKRGYDIIMVKRFPDSGIGRALNDRLQRAAAGHFPPKYFKKAD